MYYVIALIILILVCVLLAYLLRSVVKLDESTTRVVLVCVALIGIIMIATGYFPAPPFRR